jgi:hypothetical protein
VGVRGGGAFDANSAAAARAAIDAACSGAAQAPTAWGAALAALLPLLRDDAAVAAQRQGFAETLAKLRAPEGSPSDAAAAAVLAALP